MLWVFVVVTAVLYFLRDYFIFCFGRIILKLKNLRTKAGIRDGTSLQALDRAGRLEFGVSES